MSLEDMLDALRELIAAAEAEGRDLTADEAERAADLTKQIEAAKARAEVRSAAEALLAPVRPGIAVARSLADVTEEQIEFRNAFFEGRLGSVAQFRAQSSSTTAGGYTIPASFLEKLVQRKKAFGGIVNHATEITTDDWTSMPFPTLDDTSNSAEIVAENAAPASAGADITFGTKSLDAYRLVASGASNTWLKVPFQLRDSSYLSFETLVANLLGERLGRKEAYYAAVGTGSGEPQGLLTGLTPAFEIADNTAGISYAELVDAEHAVDIAYREMGNCVWVMHDAIWKLIRKLEDTAGRPLAMEQAVAGLTNGTQKTLLGYPVVIDNSLPSTWGDQSKTLVFGDIREAMLVRRVHGVQIFSDPLQFALNGQVGFLAASGFGSLVANPNAATVISGHNDT